MSTPSYVILGAGRQGTAAAYDLIQHGHAGRVVFADANLDAARAAVDRVAGLTGQSILSAVALEVRDHAALCAVLQGHDVALSAVPYYFNVDITRAAIETGVSLVDMGGHTGVVRRQLEFDAEARAAGVVVLPDCGMGPGLINVLAVRATELLDDTDEIVVVDAGLPQRPTPPWNYQCAFNLNGLTNEYDGWVPLLRNGKIVDVEALSEPEPVEIPGFGTFESFIAAGGSTAPWSFEGRLRRFETRIMRYPGHHAWFSGFKALGLFSEEPVEVDGQMVVPRALFHTLLAPHITAPVVEDVCLMRCIGSGLRAGSAAVVNIDIVDRYDPDTGFTGMERLTGWHCAAMMTFIAHGAMPAGARALEARLLERTPTADQVLTAMATRGIHHAVTWE